MILTLPKSFGKTAEELDMFQKTLGRQLNDYNSSFGKTVILLNKNFKIVKQRVEFNFIKYVRENMLVI